MSSDNNTPHTIVPASAKVRGDRFALVVGGSSAIGQAVIAGLRQEGFAVRFTFNSKESLARSISEASGGACTCTRLDLTDLAAVEGFVQALWQEPAPEVLVNCAGVTADALSIRIARQLLEAVTRVNYLAPVLIANGVAERMMRARKGAIVHVTSTAARKAKAGNGAYGSSKIALERFSASLALEVARFGVRTLCVAPGFVDTPMFESYVGGRRDEVIRNVPAGKILSPDQVAEVVLAFVRGVIPTTGVSVTLGNGEFVFS